MTRSTPPFRADMVGSLLRTQPLKEARAKREAGVISSEALRAVEDQEIRAIIAKQEEIGLNAVTDGEFRRAFWHFDFIEGLEGVEGFWKEEGGVAFQGAMLKPRAQRVVGDLKFPADHPMIEHFRFVMQNTSRIAKMTIPSPSMVHYRGGREMIDRAVYPHMEDFYADLGSAYAGAVGAFADAGCRYLQLDDVSFAYLCDPDQRQMLKQRGDDPEKQPEIYAGMINKAVAGRPADMTVTMHMCRGNFRSTFIASGGYEPVAELLFNGVDVDGYFMEWDTGRAGGFEPLRFLPKGKTVVLGLVTSKTGTLENKDDIKRRIDEAAKYCDLDQLCLSPQCGFASTEEGNVLAEEEQWAKLRMIVEIAEEVWG
jgi:5-methyltetrahydropteroyltriglutamate--homocysteine methyltransferase